ncbi:MAG TPA: bifunctional RNase H/acid phosphatase [Candidatus Eisenbacteria bacterium]|nr:bifunctional RNase H/acid phosphatase [Candidatus Eisenbacteria bacterium]
MRRLVIEADGGSRGNPGPAAYGTVVRDGDTGELLAELAEHIGVASNNVAEYRGLIAGLTRAREIDPDAQIEARLDSKLVVEQMSGRWKIKHPAMKPLALQAREIFPPERVTYVWVPRESNKHADRLANEAMDAAARGDVWSAAPRTPRATAVVQPPTGQAAEPAAGTQVEPPANALIGWGKDLGVPTTFVLLRHGQTDHTVSKRFSGSGGDDPELSEEGRRQARAAAELLLGRGSVQAVVSSPLRRARQTADIVAAALRLDVREVDGLRECDFGKWDGHTFAEVHERWPDDLAAWLASTAVAPPAGESFDDVERRVRRTRDQLVTRYAGKTVLVVTHVTPIKMMVQAALGAPMSSLFRMELQPASLTAVQWFADGNASLRLFNDTGHLRRDPGTI